MNCHEIARQLIRQWIHRTGANVTDGELRELMAMVEESLNEWTRFMVHEEKARARLTARWVAEKGGNRKEEVQ